MYKLLIWLFFVKSVTPINSTTQSHYVANATVEYLTYSNHTNYLTDTSTAWYQAHSESTTYPTPTTTYAYPWYTNYPTATTSAWYQAHSESTTYPTPTTTYGYPWYTNYPTATTSAWYQAHSESTTYPTPTTTYGYPWYTNYPTATTSAWYQAHSESTTYPTPTTTYGYQWYTNYPTATTSAWYQAHSESTTYPTPITTYAYPWYTNYPTESSTNGYPWHIDYDTQSSSRWNAWYTNDPSQSSTYRYSGNPFYSTDSTTPVFSSGHLTSTAQSSFTVVQPFTTVNIITANSVLLEGTSTPNDHSVEFHCNPNTTDHGSINVINMTLDINSTADCNVIIRAYEFRIVHTRDITNLATSGNLKGNEISIKTSANSRIVLNNIIYDLVDVVMLDSSNVILWGTGRTLNITQGGQGTFDARSFSTDHALIYATNTGLVKVKSNNQLSILVNGLGDIIWCSPSGDIKIQRPLQNIPPNVIYYCE